MQNPSHGVAHTLINHVHLISNYRFPVSAHLGVEGAYSYLLDAPQIVKQHAAMSWTYVSAPQDGTIWMEWLSPDRVNDRFPSDGYVWADQEQAYSQNYGGFQIEVLVHAVGYRPGYDAVATHARTRYHFVSKNPTHNAAPPDPQLWIVHYHATEPQRQMPVQQIPANPQTQQILRERAWLELQGRLEKKDFMLHDREHWPTINVPTTRQQPMPQQNAWPAQQQPQYSRFPNAYPQQPPAKRQRQQAPPIMPGQGEAVHDTSIEDEENTTLGDYFDHLTPRDISMARYLQHHHWMEEVFSSPYATHQIVPADLGLGLMGELKGLTDGILEPPSMDFSDHAERPLKPKEAQPFTNLKQEQLDEFNKRVAKHLEAGQAEIERMKAEHAAKMQEWKKTKTLMQAEKKLRHATWEGHENAVKVHRLEVPANGHTDPAEGKGNVEDIVKEVEGILNVKITPHKGADMVERGGLEDEEEPRRDEVMQQDAYEAPKQQPQSFTNDATPAAMYSQNPMPSAHGQGQTQNQAPAAPNTAQQATAQPPPLTSGAESSTDHLGTDGLNDDSLLDGMDLDMNDTGVDFGGDDHSHLEAPSAQPTAPATSTQPQAAPSNQAVPATDTTTTNAAPDTNSAFPDPSADANNIFGDSTFDDLTNMDEHDAADDGLIDFEGGVGLEDSAFGDALHGMEDGADVDAGQGAGDGAA